MDSSCSDSYVVTLNHHRYFVQVSPVQEMQHNVEVVLQIIFYNVWNKGLVSGCKEDFGDARLLGLVLVDLEKGKNPLDFIPLWTDLKSTNQCPDIFLESVLLAIQISHGAKEQLTSVRKEFQACGYSLALLFIAVVLRLFHCFYIFYNRKGFKKNPVFKKFRYWRYSLLIFMK